MLEAKPAQRTLRVIDSALDLTLAIAASRPARQSQDAVVRKQVPVELSGDTRN